MQRLYLSGIQLIAQRLRPIGRLFAQSLLLLVIFCGLAPIVYTAIDKPSRPQAGLRNSNGSRRMSAAQLQKTVESLRHKTGFLEMRFDESGFLTLGGQTRFVGGSATARDLLIATVNERLAIELEGHNNSPHIAFARISGGTVYTHFQTKARIEARQVQIDFSDFAELRGEPEAMAAFDLGFAILHELVHAVCGLRDAAGETTELGECDELINRMRRELNLPERQGYSARAWVILSATGATMRAELVFARERVKSGRARIKRFYLHWDAKRVAGATNSKNGI